ncbi:unnamed protein product, partial [Oikopleura dioica]
MRLATAAFISAAEGSWDAANKCWKGPTSRYSGDISKTQSGKTCQKWSLDVPHVPKHRPADPEHNHCRNPDLDLAGPWCYTTDPETRWEYCNIDSCDDQESYVVWTNFDSDNQSSHLVKVHANPEVVRNQTDTSGSFSVHAITMSNSTETKSEFWALGADYNNKRIYWTDYRAQQIGMYDWENSETREGLYKGMAHGIENLAVDWVTGNVYWTDSDYKWIMVADKDFNHFNAVYKAADDPNGPPYGLAIHSTKQYIFWSTYKIMGAKILRADLTADGMDATKFKTITSFPTVHDVTGLTVDYSDDRLYWTDFLGSAAVVSSSDLDGNNVVQHFHRTGSVFWGVDTFDHYLYVTDIYPKFMNEEHLKDAANEQKSFRYSLSGRPRSVTVYSPYSTPIEDVPVNPCAEDAYGLQGGCEHICIPSKPPSGATKNRTCMCSIGYTLKKPQQVGCYADFQKAPFLVFADIDHGLIFQMAMNDSLSSEQLEKHEYNVIPSELTDEIHALCVDQSTQTLFYADKTKKILVSKRQSEPEKIVAENIIALSCAIDPLGKNIFIVESETRNIQVISYRSQDIQLVKTVVDIAASSEVDTQNTQNVALDLERKRVCWTDPTLTENKGRIECANFDGSDRKEIFNELNWPQGVKFEKFNLLFTEALSGIVYEIKLSKIDTISSEKGLSGQELQNIALDENDSSVTMYNISAAMPRVKQFQMDVETFGDYIYYADLKHNAVERINRKVFKETGKLDRPQQYGPGEFFSIASLHIVTDELSDKYDSKCDECDDSKLCLLVRNEDGSNGYKCECPDNSDLGVDGACLAGTTKEYSIINCPAATIVSADKCRLVADYAIEYPSIESDGVVESPENFEWNFYSRFSGGDRDAFTFSDSKADKVLQLKQGRTVIVLEGTKNEGADEVRCSWSVDVSVATCDWTNIFLPADVEPFQSSCQPTGSFVMPGEKEPSGQLINLRCKDEAKRIQPYLNGVKFQDVEDKSASLRSLTTSSDLSECENREDLGGEGIVAKECKVTRGGSDLPMKSMLYECKPDAEDNKFVHPFSHLVEGDITFKCEIPASPPRGLPATPTEDNNEDVTPKSMDTDAEKTADSPKKKSFAGLIIFFVVLLVAVVGFILYKRMKNEYGGFSVRNLV